MLSKRKDVISERPDLAMDEFYETHYSDSGIEKELVSEILNFVANEMCTNPRKIRPNDRFSDELKSNRLLGWDSGFGVLAVALKTAAKSKGINVERSIETVDDYIKEMAKVY